MQSRLLTKPLAGMALAALLLAVVLSVALGAPSRLLAQDAPTPTPTDPLWRAFSALRDAIEEEKSADLTIVKNYEWEQQEYDGGIDACKTLENPADYRDIYWGWTFTITSMTNQVYQGRVSFDLKAVAVCEQVSTAAATPVPGGDTNLPAPVAGSAASGSFELGGHVLQLNANTVSLMQRAGMTWMKVQLRYSPGTDPGVASQYISEAHGRGFKILLGVVGYPNDLAAGGAGYMQQFASFLGGVASQGPDAIEVWNEPNIDREWPEGQISGASYAEMLRLAYQAIKGANGGVMVISAAPAPTGAEAAYPGRVVNDDRFVRDMVAAGAANYMDCLGAHYNEGIVGPSQRNGDPRDGYYTRYFFGMLDTYWNAIGGARPICFTELGYLTPEGYPPLDPYFGWAANVTVSQQAAWLAEAAALASQSGRVRLMIIWNVDFSNYGTDPMAGYAMIRPGGGCPACDALAGAR